MRVTQGAICVGLSVWEGAGARAQMPGVDGVSNDANTWPVSDILADVGRCPIHRAFMLLQIVHKSRDGQLAYVSTEDGGLTLSVWQTTIWRTK